MDFISMLLQVKGKGRRDREGDGDGEPRKRSEHGAEFKAERMRG